MKMRRLKKMSPEVHAERTFLKKSAYSFMIITFVLLGLIYSYVFGIDLLSKIFPSIPKPLSPSSSNELIIFFDIILPILCLVGSICFIYLSLRDVIADKHHYNIRSEFVLIANCLLIIGLNIQYLADNIQPAGKMNETLYSMSLFLVLFIAATLIVAILDRYIREKRK
jgi:hypothetical protein